jgi:hypothetical protein
LNKKKKLLKTNANKRPLSFLIRDIIVNIMCIGILFFLPGRRSSKSPFELIFTQPVETFVLILVIALFAIALMYFGSMIKSNRS